MDKLRRMHTLYFIVAPNKSPDTLELDLCLKKKLKRILRPLLQLMKKYAQSDLKENLIT